METTVEALEGNRVRLHVAVPAPEFEGAIDAAFRKLAGEVKIPGFRPGKAPRRLLEARFGSQAARDQALQDSLPEYYGAAVVENEGDASAARHARLDRRRGGRRTRRNRLPLPRWIGHRRTGARRPDPWDAPRSDPPVHRGATRAIRRPCRQGGRLSRVREGSEAAEAAGADRRVGRGGEGARDRGRAARRPGAPPPH